jgi:hypothetical protein
MNKLFKSFTLILICGYTLNGCISVSPLPELPSITTQPTSAPQPCSKPEPALPEPIPDNLSLNIEEGRITTIDKGGEKFLGNYESLISNYPRLVLLDLIPNANIKIKDDRIIDADSGGERLIRSYAATRKAIKSEATK